jgi:hypothetical protein
MGKTLVRTRSVSHVLLIVALIVLLFPMLPPSGFAEPETVVNTNSTATEATVVRPPPTFPYVLPLLAPIITTTTFATSTMEAVFPALFMAAEPGYAHVGDLVTVTVLLCNEGNVALEGTTISVTVPAGLAVTDPGGGQYDPPSGLLSWSLPSVEPAGQVVYTFRGHATGQALLKGRILLSASLQGGDRVFNRPRAGELIVVANAPFEVVSTADISTILGGHLGSADGRVQVSLPPGILQAPGLLRTRHIPYGLLGELAPEDLAPRRTSFRPVLRSFALQAEDAQGNPIHQFDAPLTITVQYDPEEVRALGLNEADLSLFWWDADLVLTPTEGVTVTGAWMALPSTVDVAARTVTAQTKHFSAFTLSDGSSVSEAFLPGVQGFQVSLYTGAASFQIPLVLPTGPGGLAPSLSLSYNSAATDGFSGKREKQQAGWAGKGWSLDVGEVALVKGRSQNEADDSYTLALNGATYDLVRGEPKVANPHPSHPWDYYWHPTDETFLKVWVEDVGESARNTHWDIPYRDTVWVVLTRDGTRYEFGDRNDHDFGNRTWWGFQSCGTLGLGGDEIEGDYAYLETNRWLLTRVQDPHGNTIRYEYDRLETAVGLCFHVDGTVQDDVWPRFITWGDESSGGLCQVEFSSTLRALDKDYEQDPGRVPHGVHETRQLNEVRVWSSTNGGAQWSLVRMYGLSFADADGSVRSDASCKVGEAPNQPCPTRKLTLLAVQEYGGDGESKLPGKEFTYYMDRGSDPVPDGGWNRLATYDNGYSGTVTMIYENIEASEGVHFANRHRVTAMVVEDGLGGAYTTTYAYDGAAVNDPEHSAVVAAAGGYLNRLVHQAYREFRGHAVVTVTNPGGYQSEHTFLQTDELKGKEVRTRALGASEAELYQSSAFTYSVEVLTHTQAYQLGLLHNFVYLAEQSASTYDRSEPPRTTRTEYYYEPGRQGGAQYGNQTRVVEYGEGETPYRTTVRSYVVNSDPEVWIVDRVLQEEVHAGNESGTLLSQTEYYYDRNPDGSLRDWAAPPLRGDVVAVRRINVNPPESPASPEQFTEAWFDSHGNKVKEEDGRDNATRYGYDPLFHAYLITATYANQSTESAAYDYRLGAITRVTDVNGFVTRAEYDDPFGRVTALRKPGDETGAPTVAFAYHDYGDFLLHSWPYMSAVWRKYAPDAQVWETGGTYERRFYDGRSLLVEVQQGPDPSGWEIIQYFQYDGVGQKVRESRPYFEDAYAYGRDPGSGRIINPYKTPRDWEGTGQDQAELKGTESVYDPVGRAIETISPDGSVVTTSYDRWVTTVVDANGHQRQSETDAFDRLIVVREYTGTYPTAEEYATSRYGYRCMGLSSATFSVVPGLL